MTAPITDEQIVDIAKKAGLPSGWYSGPWFEQLGGKTQLKTGLPPCLRRFVELVRRTA